MSSITLTDHSDSIECQPIVVDIWKAKSKRVKDEHLTQNLGGSLFFQTPCEILLLWIWSDSLLCLHSSSFYLNTSSSVYVNANGSIYPTLISSELPQNLIYIFFMTLICLYFLEYLCTDCIACEFLEKKKISTSFSKLLPGNTM